MDLKSAVRNYLDHCSCSNIAISHRNCSIKWIFLWRLSIQNHSKPSINEKRRNKVKCLSWNSMRLKFGKKASVSNPVKSLGYIKCHNLSSPRPTESPSNSIRYNCEKICRWSRRPKTILEIKKGHIYLGDQQLYYLKAFQRLY